MFCRARLAGGFPQSGVDVKRAAAGLAVRDGHLAAVAPQHAHRGFVQAGEEHVRHAAAEQRDPVSAAARRAAAPGRTTVELRHLGRGARASIAAHFAHQLQQPRAAHQGSAGRSPGTRRARCPSTRRAKRDGSRSLRTRLPQQYARATGARYGSRCAPARPPPAARTARRKGRRSRTPRHARHRSICSM